MLHEFIAQNREAIIRRTRTKLTSRPWPCASADELEHGVPLFLTQLAATLRWEMTSTPFAADAIGSSATRHGGDLLALGFSVAQVVHAYGDICQSVTELAMEQDAPITTTEFRILNRCLDTAIAEAVTEHARGTAQTKSTDEIERLGYVAHQTRDILNTAILAFETLKRGAVGINGSTAAILGRSLMDLRDFVGSTLSEIRMEGAHQRRERTTVSSLLDDVAAAGALHAEYKRLQFVFEPVETDLPISADPQLLQSAVLNLLNNAFKFTRTGGRVILRTRYADGLVAIEVEDECGGIPEGISDAFQPFGKQRGADRTGLGLGLSIARRAVRAHGGDIHVRNLPGQGCVFCIKVPLAVDASHPLPTAR